MLAPALMSASTKDLTNNDKKDKMNEEQYQEPKGKFKKEFTSRCHHRGFERKEDVAEA